MNIAEWLEGNFGVVPILLYKNEDSTGIKKWTCASGIIVDADGRKAFDTWADTPNQCLEKLHAGIEQCSSVEVRHFSPVKVFVKTKGRWKVINNRVSK